MTDPPCGHPRAADPVPGCPYCVIRDHPFHVARWAAGGGLELPVAPGPCVHLGKPTGEVRECAACGGNVRLKVMGCKIHGQCTVGRPVSGLAYCGACPDRRT